MLNLLILILLSSLIKSRRDVNKLMLKIETR